MLRSTISMLASARKKAWVFSRFLVTIAALAVLAACGDTPKADTFEEPAELGTVSSALLTLQSLSVSPPTASRPAGVTQLFKASGLYSDGKTRTFTSGITWSSSDPAIASIAVDGTALTVSPGVVTITALHPATGILATATLTVTSETLVSIAVTPATRAVGIGATVNYVATAKFSGGTSVALKGPVVTWRSSHAAIDANGKVVTMAADEGVSTITARHLPSGREASAQLLVSSSPLTAITVSPIAPRMPKGTSQRFTATGVLANGMTSDLTEAATWSSSNVNVATVAQSGAPPSIDVNAVGVGTAAIRAKFGTLTGSSTVTVPAAVLTSLTITPPSPRISLGTSPQLVATGTYDDLTTVDRTEFVTWSSSATSIVKVSTAAGSRGTLTPVKVGTATITARDAKTLVTTTTVVTVTNVTLVGLSITPATTDAPLGTTTAFHATGTYSDATTQDLTNAVTWSSANANATISNASPTQGVATATTVGSTTITAQLGAIRAEATLNVTPARLVRLEMVSPTVSLIRDLSQQLDVNGIYTDGSTVNLDTAVGWTSSDHAIASVSNEPESQGVLTALAVGSATITATDPVSGLSASTAATVTAPTLVRILLSGLLIQYPRTVKIPRGISAPALAMGVYSNATGVPFNEVCTWTSSNPSAIAVSNVAGEKGKLTGLELGSSTITVTEPVSGITQSLVFETVAPRMVDVSIVPGDPDLFVGQTLPFTTRANFSDGTVGPVDVSWRVTNPTLASLDSAPEASQATVNLTALQAGQVDLIASTPLGDRGVTVMISAAEMQLAVGENHACALIPNAGVKCWGGNNIGQLGIGNNVWHGQLPSDMGHALPFVALGSGRVAKAITAGARHTCALLTGGDVKCWGFNAFGQLGLGDSATRGVLPGQMGDDLPLVQLGTGLKARAIAAGRAHTCALLTNRTVKCWGLNGNGQLGLEDRILRGTLPSHMGDQLPTVNLGTGRTAKRIVAGGDVTCAQLDDDSFKCWGDNTDGRLGIGDLGLGSQSRGDEPGEMGDALAAMSFGAGRGAKSISLSGGGGCAVLGDGNVRCWGAGDGGQLGTGNTLPQADASLGVDVDLGVGRTAISVGAFGSSGYCAQLDDLSVKCWGSVLGLGDTEPRGDEPGEMGDALPALQFGTGRRVKAMAGSHDLRVACVVLENDDVKCWGINNYAQVGLGEPDTDPRGNAPNEMGDFLPAVHLLDCVPRPDNLLGWWRGEGDAADVLHGHDGVVAGGTTYGPGMVGNSFVFDGSGSVAIESGGFPAGSADRTLENWIRVDADLGAESFFSGYGGFGTFTGSYGLGALAGRQPFFSQWGSGLVAPTIALGSWHHVAVTNVGSVPTLYVDGVPASSSPMTINTTAGLPMYIGAIPGDNYRRLAGAVDEVALYGRALSETEIARKYAVGAYGMCH